MPGPQGPQGLIGPKGPGIDWTKCKIVSKSFSDRHSVLGELDCGAGQIAISGGCHGYANGAPINYFKDVPCSTISKGFIFPAERCFGGVPDEEAIIRGRYCAVQSTVLTADVGVIIFLTCCPKP